MKRGCLCCYSSNIDRAIEVFNGFYPDIHLVYPQRIRRRHYAGNIHMDEIVPLLPGYLFFETDHDLPKEKLARTNYLLRLLTYTDGEWELRGADDYLAKMVIDANGQIGLSKAYYGSDRRIRIVDGFLKPYEDSIIRVNRRNWSVEIEISFQERQINLWLGLDMDEKAS